MSVITEECWQKVFKAVREQFEIDNSLPEVKIFENLSTRYGKSFIFQCLPSAVDSLFCSVFPL